MKIMLGLVHEHVEWVCRVVQWSKAKWKEVEVASTVRYTHKCDKCVYFIGSIMANAKARYEIAMLYCRGRTNEANITKPKPFIHLYLRFPLNNP